MRVKALMLSRASHFGVKKVGLSLAVFIISCPKHSHSQNMGALI